MASKKFALTAEMIDAVSARFRLLGEPARLRLLQQLEGGGEATVNELATAVGSSQPNVSRHLNAMYEGGLLSRRRDGSNIYYSIGDPMVFELCAIVCNSVRAKAQGRLKALARAARE